MRRGFDQHIKWELEPDRARLIRAQLMLETNPAQALDELKKLATNGSPMSMYYIGIAYAFGKGVTIDLDKAECWYLRAAEAGSERAYYELGRLYLKAKKYGESKKAFERSAAGGFMPAVHMLGRMYFFGYGVDKDFQKAKPLLERAATWGSVFAKRLLAYQMMHSRQGWRVVWKGLVLQCRVYVDAVVVLFSEGTSSDRFR